MGKQIIFDSPEQLRQYVQVNAEEIISSEATTITSNKAQQRAEATLLQRAKELQAAITANFKSVPIKPSHRSASRRLFPRAGMQQISTNQCKIDFADAFYRDSAWQGHQSFVPILLEYGWHWPGTKYPRSIQKPTYQYYAGAHFITKAVNEFNAKYKHKGIYATFCFGDTDVTVYAGKLPYKK